MSERAPADIVRRLGRRSVIVCCGSGGVGKTTVSAALGMGLMAERAERVLVLTVDPARRLATALGIGEIGARPVPVPARRLRAAGVDPQGELSAAMLDVKGEWDRLVVRHAPSVEVRDRIMSNRFYRGVSTAFAGSHDYMALQALLEHLRGGAYDRIVVDTPPSRDALTLLDAPARITDFVGARLLSWPASPSRAGWRALNLAATPFLRMADRLLGADVLEELAAFVRDMRYSYDGVRAGAEDVASLLRSDEAGFAVVTTLEREPLAEAERFCVELGERSMPLRAVVVNRVLPPWLRGPEAVTMAAALRDEGAPCRWGEALLTLHELASAEAAQAARLGRLGHVPIAALPLADRDVHDLAALGRLATLLRGAEGPGASGPSRLDVDHDPGRR